MRITGTDSANWTPLLSTVASGKTKRGKYTFLMSAPFEANEATARINDTCSQVQGNNPVRSTRP